MAEPAVILAQRAFHERLLAQEAAQMQAMAQRWLGVERALEGRIEALAQQMKDAQPSQAQLLRNEQYRALLSQAQGELGQYETWAEGLIETMQATMAQQGVQDGAAAITATGFTASFDVLPVEAVLEMVGLTDALAPLTELLKAAWPEAAQALTQALINGTALGWNPRKTARAMADGLAQGLDRMLTIARTEQIRAYRLGQLEQYKASGVVKGFRRLATLDDRTCLACLIADGEEYSLDEQIRDHPNGRCGQVPIVVGMPALSWQTGRDWFENLDSATQQQMMGAGRFEAWQDGKFDLGDLVQVVPDDRWGASVRPAPLKSFSDN